MVLPIKPTPTRKNVWINRESNSKLSFRVIFRTDPIGQWRKPKTRFWWRQQYCGLQEQAYQFMQLYSWSRWGFTKLTGGWIKSKYHSIVYPTGSSQVKRPVRRQLAYQIYRSKRSLETGWLSYQYWNSINSQRETRCWLNPTALLKI